MKRLFACIYTHNSWGGIERWLEGLLGFFARHDWDVVVGLALGRKFNDPRHVAHAYSQFRTVVMDGRTGTPEGRKRAVARAVRNVNPDIVMPLGLSDVYEGVARAKQQGCRVRLLAALHAINHELLHEMTCVEPHVDLCVGVNPLQMEFLREFGNFDERRLRAIINGVALPAQPRPMRDHRSPIRLLFVGRLTHFSKRVLDLVPLVEKLSSSGVDWRLTVVGTGEDEEELRRRMQPHIAAQRVQFMGYLTPEALYETVYPAHDVLLVLSPELGEACPLVIQESLAHGVIPVCSEFIGIHSLGFVRHGETGYIFECGNIAAAAKCLAQIAGSSEELERLAQAAATESQRLNIELVHQRWLDLLDELADWEPRAAVGPASRGVPDQTAGHGRLDRYLPAGIADRLRHVFRRWPEFSDGWHEWPGTTSVPGEDCRRRMTSQLRSLDHAAREGVGTY